jgi:hypothetical protein
MAHLRILLVADSHIGLDLPDRPRVVRRRRGDDFLANHAAALEPALRGEVDLVVHGGDVFHRPRVADGIAHRAYAPLLRVAEQGVPVLIVPGNHERSVLPHRRLLAHPRVHVFDRPRTFALDVAGRRVALAGFPYERRAVRSRMADESPRRLVEDRRHEIVANVERFRRRTLTTQRAERCLGVPGVGGDRAHDGHGVQRNVAERSVRECGMRRTSMQRAVNESAGDPPRRGARRRRSARLCQPRQQPLLPPPSLCRKVLDETVSER